MLQKVEQSLVFENKRDRSLVTPCCNRTNKDSKFVNFKGYPSNYGYCHSCGETTLPPTVYKDELGREYIWNDVSNTFEPYVTQLYDKLYYKSVDSCNTKSIKSEKNIKYVDFEIIEMYYKVQPENNLLQYLRRTYGDEKVDIVKQMYYIGTNKDLGTVFWSINSQGKTQKAKVSYYRANGKRTKYFKVPYKNEDGYYSCLFGEHLINKEGFLSKTVVLVESEKTAIVCAMHFPKYLWLAYGGINGLTEDKLGVLKGRRVVLVPDISENAVAIMKKKLPLLLDSGIEAKIWDMTKGKSDGQLKTEGLFNCDLEDFIRLVN
ncbi:DUF6371 domain-containing protein [Mangrovimonas xylaniphaga]|uniref:DUF6371 domain-containing protein n=1 Tax=Mangrovimonas xylaniphaga TaxID=1645915 RepID=UPI0006B44856|nr:DUF6371 domain-containing protein [Mangrovimonas xylaniphaga]